LPALKGVFERPVWSDQFENLCTRFQSVGASYFSQKLTFKTEINATQPARPRGSAHRLGRQRAPLPVGVASSAMPANSLRLVIARFAFSPPR
jgi:hypothetical protein